MASSRTDRGGSTRKKPATKKTAKPAAAVKPAREAKAVPEAQDGAKAVKGAKPGAKSAKVAARAPARKGLTDKAPKGARAAAGRSDGGGKSLVIVESPTKSRTLTKFLGRGFSVLASNGHIMDLPKSELGVDLDNDFEPQYVPIRGKTAALAKIRAAAENADRIFLAPDPDREGE